MKSQNVIFLGMAILTNVVSAQSPEKLQMATLAPQLNFHGTRETLEKIKQIIFNKEKGAYMRFGDGDIVLAYGEHDLMQSPNANLQYEMREAFGLNNKNILKTLPTHNREIGTLEVGMFPGNHETNFEQCLNFIRRVKPLWNSEISDVYSLVALHHLACVDSNYCIEFLKFIKQSNW